MDEYLPILAPLSDENDFTVPGLSPQPLRKTVHMTLVPDLELDNAAARLASKLNPLETFPSIDFPGTRATSWILIKPRNFPLYIRCRKSNKNSSE